jgi:hypothetical protein
MAAAWVPETMGGEGVEMRDSATGGRLPGRTGHRVVVLPTTKLGRWALALAVSNVVLVLAWSVLPGGAAPGFACGLAGGVVGLRAIVRQQERALAVYAALVPFAMVVAFVLAELLIGYD